PLRLVTFAVARLNGVDVDIEVRETAPDDTFVRWNSVVEGSLAVPSGRIDIAGCTMELKAAPRFQLAPGNYRMRVYTGGLQTLHLWRVVACFLGGRSRETSGGRCRV